MKYLKILVATAVIPLIFASHAFAQEDTVTTTSQDTTTSSDDEYYYDDSYYDDSYYDTYDYSDYGYDYSTESAAGMFGGMMALLFGGVMLFVSIVVGVGSYVYCSLALMKIAKRLNYENAWYAWIPILNMVLLFQLFT